MTDNAVEISNLSFSYPRRNVQVLHGLDINIRRGSIVGLMGGSGSGKTTILRLLTGQNKIPATADIRINGESIKDMSLPELYRIRRGMGLLFQQSGLFTDMSVGDNIAFPLREHTRLPLAVIHDLALMKLHAVGLHAAINRYPSELSGGQQRRVALARTIALDPQILLYDEPFAGLDPVSLSVIAQLIKELNVALGATSIIITHDVPETFAIVDEVYLLWHGRVVSSGSPAQMRSSAEPIVDQFIHGKADGPLPFHMPGAPLEGALRLAADAAE